MSGWGGFRVETGNAVVGSAVAVAAALYLYHNGTTSNRTGPTLYADEPMPSNGEWSQFAYQHTVATGYHPELAARSLRKFNGGQYLNGEEYAFMMHSINTFGPPPVQPPMPKNSPTFGVQSSTGPQPVNSYTSQADNSVKGGY